MSEMIEERQTSPGDGNDLLSNLVEANSGDDDDKLTASELMGNTHRSTQPLFSNDHIRRKYFHFSPCRS